MIYNNNLDTGKIQRKGREEPFELAFYFLVPSFVCLFVFTQICERHEEVGWTLKHISNLKASQLFQNSDWLSISSGKNAYQAVHSYQLLGIAKNLRRTVGISSPRHLSSPCHCFFLTPAFQMAAESRRHQSCRIQFVSVQAYQSQLLQNDSEPSRRRKPTEGCSGKGDLPFPCAQLKCLKTQFFQKSPQMFPLTWVSGRISLSKKWMLTWKDTFTLK